MFDKHKANMHKTKVHTKRQSRGRLKAVGFFMFFLFFTPKVFPISDGDFLSRTESKIKKYWQVPERYLEKNRNPTSEINVRVSFGGKIIRIELIKPSGFSDFDDSCVAALKKAYRLPIPPSHLAEQISEKGLIFVFTKNSVKFFPGGSSQDVCDVAMNKAKNGSYKFATFSENEPYFYHVHRVVDKKYSLSSYDQRGFLNETLLGPTEFSTVAGFDINAGGKIEKTELFCPSSSEKFNGMVLGTLKKIGSFDSPPSHLLGKDGYLRLMLLFTIKRD